MPDSADLPVSPDPPVARDAGHRGDTGISSVGVVAVPWANGLGTTRELLTIPCPTARHAFGVRCSLAELIGRARFSPLPGVRRVFTLVGKHGGELTIEGEGRAADRLVPIAFDGDDDVAFTPIAPTRAFNVMTCRCGTPSVSVVGRADRPDRSASTGGIAGTIVGRFALRGGDGHGVLRLGPPSAGAPDERPVLVVGVTPASDAA